MKNLLLKLKNELIFSNECKKIFLQACIIALFMFLSIWWKGFSICVLLISVACIILNRSVKSLYILIFLLPFMSIFKFNTNGSYLLTYVVIAFIATLGLQLFVDLIKQRKKLNILLTILFAVFVMFLLLQINLSNLSIFLSLVLGMTLLYVLYYFKEELNFKEIVFVFGFGILLSIIIGWFLLASSRLKEMITIYYEIGEIRFSGCAENVNVFAGELMIMLAAFTCLYFKREINYFYAPIYTLSFLTLIFTVSKSSLIIFFVITLFLIINSAITKKKKCYWDVILAVGTVLIVFILTQDRFIICFKRLFNIPIDGSTSQFMSDLTTGRTEIWLQYLRKICSSVKTFLIGLGISARPIGYFNGYSGASTHNTIIQCLYHTGVIGLILFACFLLTYIGWKKVFKLKVWNVLMIVSVGLFLCGLDFFSYRFSNYFILIVLSYSVLNNTNTSESTVKNNGSNKILKMITFVFSWIFYGVPAFLFAMIMKLKHKDLWLVYECGSYARDNGYWFYKYLRENHPEQEVVYVIKKDSPDYDKVSKLGKVCGFRTFKHWYYYFLCSKEISSHPHFKPTYFINKRFWLNKTYFLQHGITRDFTGYTADKMKIKLFVTAAIKEDEFIKQNYGYDDSVVQLLGFARHDNLINNEVKKSQILIMPTWRKYLIDATEEDFVNSEYYKSWMGVLNSHELLEMLEKSDKYIVFYPHRELQKFVHLFNVKNNRIIIADINNYDVQTLLKESALLITDYSSVFFDFAYMKKPVIWYLFDEDIYHKGHHSKGYFDERNNILGEYVKDHENLFEKIKSNISNDFALNAKQIENVENFFAYFDGKNCERIYEKIKEIN